MTQLGTLLKARRKELGFTQAELALTLGMSYVAVCQFETGKGRSNSNPTVATIMKLSKAYKLKPLVLFAAIERDYEHAHG